MGENLSIRWIIIVALSLFVIGLSACDTAKRMADTVTPDVISDRLPQDWFADNENDEDGDDIPSDEKIAETDPKIKSGGESQHSESVRRDYDELENSLLADRKNAQYTDQELRKMVPPLSIGLATDTPSQQVIESQTITNIQIPAEGPVQTDAQRPIPRPAPQTPVVERPLDTNMPETDQVTLDDQDQSFENIIQQNNEEQNRLARAESLPDAELTPLIMEIIKSGYLKIKAMRLHHSKMVL